MQSWKKMKMARFSFKCVFCIFRSLPCSMIEHKLLIRQKKLQHLKILFILMCKSAEAKYDKVFPLPLRLFASSLHTWSACSKNRTACAPFLLFSSTAFPSLLHCASSWRSSTLTLIAVHLLLGINDFFRAQNLLLFRVGIFRHVLMWAIKVLRFGYMVSVFSLYSISHISSAVAVVMIKDNNFDAPAR